MSTKEDWPFMLLIAVFVLAMLMGGDKGGCTCTIDMRPTTEPTTQPSPTPIVRPA